MSRKLPGLALLATLAAGAARADGSATTLLDSHPYTRNNGYQESPVYESLAVTARGDGGGGVEDLRIVARAWGRLTFGAPFDDHRTGGDVDSLFIEGRVLQRHLLVRIGRQLAVGGAARATQLDGISIDALLAHGLGVQAWSGIPVQARFAAGRGDFFTGTRLFWRYAFDSEVGASVVYALSRGYLARKDAALDASWTPLRPVTVSGLLQWSLEEQRLAEGRLQAAWQLGRQIQLVGDISRTAPDLFLDRNSILAVFAEEQRDTAGGEIVYRILQPLSLEGDFHWLRVQGGTGYLGGGRATWRTPFGTTYGAELRLVNQPDNGYTQARLFGIRKLPRNVTITVDLDAYWLEHAVATSTTRAFVATVTSGWQVTPAFEATLAGSVGTTPNYERRLELIARLTYHFGLPGGLR